MSDCNCKVNENECAPKKNRYEGTKTEKNLEAAFAGGESGEKQVHLFRVGSEERRLRTDFVAFP